MNGSEICRNLYDRGKETPFLSRSYFVLVGPPSESKPVYRVYEVLVCGSTPAISTQLFRTRVSGVFSSWRIL